MKYVIESPTCTWLAESVAAIDNGNSGTAGYECRPAWWQEGKITYSKDATVYPRIRVVGNHTVIVLPIDYEVVPS